MIKKVVITILVIFLLLIGGLIAVPFLFKDKLLEIAKKEINSYLNATVDFNDVGLSVFKDFPKLTFSLEDVSVVNKAPFEGDTLAAIGSFSVSLDIMSVIKGDVIDINGFGLTKPRIHVKVLKDGTANYDIMKETEPKKEEAPKAETEKEIRVKLQKYFIEDGWISYDDKSSDLYAEINHLNHSGKGDFTLDVFDLQTTTQASKVTVSTGGVKYLNKADLYLGIDLGIDLPNNSYTFKENTIKINQLVLGIDGGVKIDGDKYDTDIKFKAKETSFKNILSLVPAIYLTDFKDIKTSGTLALDGFAKGVYEGESYPAFGLNLKVNDAMFQYPDLPTAVSNIFIDLNVSNAGGNLDNTLVDATRFDLKLGEEPVKMKFKVRTPISDPDIDAVLVGKIDLKNVTNYYPLGEGEELAGLVDANATFKGKLSDLEDENYEKLEAQGKIDISGLKYKGEDLPEGVEIEKMALVFATKKGGEVTARKVADIPDIKGDARLEASNIKYNSADLPGPLTVSEVAITLNPETAVLEKFEGKVGKTDLRATGQLDNLIGYALSDGTVVGRLDLNSNYLDLNEFMAESETESGAGETATADTSASIELPENVDFTLNTNIKKVLYDELTLDNVSGNVRLKDDAVNLSYLKANLLGGSAVVNGTYTASSGKPKIDLGYDIKNVDIKQAYTYLVTVEKLAPIAKYLDGKFSSTLSMKSDVGNDLSPIMESVLANGRVDINNAKLTKFKVQDILVDKFKMNQFKTIDMQHIWTVFEVVDGRVFIQPFDVNYQNINMNVSGSHGIDNTLDYHLVLTIPRSLLGNANNLINDLLNKSPIPGLNANTLPDKVKFGVAIGGTMTDPKVKIDFSRKDTEESLKERAKEELEKRKKELEEKARAEAEKLSKEAEAKARAEADKIIKEARNQAAKLKSEAQKLADQARKEGYAQAKSIEDKASNPLAKVAAKATADGIRKETDKRAQQIVDEADKKAKQVIDEANKRAQKLIDDAAKESHKVTH